jgi:hypothetical protein
MYSGVTMATQSQVQSVFIMTAMQCLQMLYQGAMVDMRML